MGSDLLHFIHTPAFDACLADLPMGDAELQAVQATLQANPEAGDMVQGTGGVRKMRAMAKGKGKRGGARVIYLYVKRRDTVYLLLAYAKSDADDLSAAEKKMLKQLTTVLKSEW